MSHPRIPPITAEHGRLWSQPARERIAVTAGEAHMTSADCAILRTYATAFLPAGTFVGKMWRSMAHGHWMLMWYDDVSADSITIEQRRIVITDALPAEPQPARIGGTEAP